MFRYQFDWDIGTLSPMKTRWHETITNMESSTEGKRLSLRTLFGLANDYNLSLMTVYNANLHLAV